MATEHFIVEAIAPDGTPVYELWSHVEFMNWDMGIDSRTNKLATNPDRSVLEKALKHLSPPPASRKGNP